MVFCRLDKEMMAVDDVGQSLVQQKNVELLKNELIKVIVHALQKDEWVQQSQINIVQTLYVFQILLISAENHGRIYEK